MIATDVAHAMVLAVFAGLGHLSLGSVDPWLLRDLLLGSIPAAIGATFLSARLPGAWLRIALAAVLFIVGAKLVTGLGAAH